MRAAVLNEIRRSGQSISVQEPGQMLETIINIVDSIINIEAEGIVAFHLLLLQHGTTGTRSQVLPNVEKAILIDRAALLQVRLALENTDDPAPNSSLAVRTGVRERPSDHPSPPKGRASSGVHWSPAGVAGEHEHSEQAGPRRSVVGACAAPPLAGSSKLCLHALEALRGPVQAMENEQQPNSDGQPPSARSWRASGRIMDPSTSSDDSAFTRVPAVSVQRSCHSPATPNDGQRSRFSSLSSDSAPVAYDPASQRTSSVSVETGMSEGVGEPNGCHSGPDAEATGLPTRRLTINTNDTRQAEPTRTARAATRWSIPRNVFLGRIAGAPSSAASDAKRNSTKTRRAAIRRIMASEPGAEESDVRQMQMLRQRSDSTAVASRRLSCSQCKRIAPLDPSTRGAELGQACRGSPVPPIREDPDMPLSLPPLTIDQALSDSLRLSRTSLMESMDDEHDGLESPSPSAPMMGERAKPPPLPCRVKADLTGDIKEGATVSNAARECSTSRRTSVTDMLLRARSRRHSLGAAEPHRRGSSSSSSPASSKATSSRRGSLSVHLGIAQSRRASIGIAAAAAFFLTDVSAEQGIVQDLRPQRQPAARSSNCTLDPLRPPVPSLTAMRGSFLGAVGGEPEASNTLRKSLSRSCIAENGASRRGSTSSMACRRASLSSRRGSYGSSAITSLPPIDHRGCAATHGPGREDGEGINELRARCLERRSSSASSCSVYPMAGPGVPRSSMLSTISASISHRRISSAPVLAKGAHSHSPRLSRLAPLRQDPMYTNRLRWSDVSSSIPPEDASRCHLASVSMCEWYDRSTIVIHPLSRLRLYWDVLIALLSLWTLMEIPLRVVFAPEERFTFMPCSSINYAACVAFCLQPVVECRTIIIVRGAPEDRPSVILKHYAHSAWMLVDALSVVCIVLDFYWPPLALLCCVRLLYAVHFVQKLEKATKTSPSIIRSVQCLLVSMPCLHWFACIFCQLSLAPGSWLEEYQVSRDDQINGSTVRIYLHAIYWTLDTASTRGSGEVNVTSDLEVLLMCVIIALSTLLYSAIIANMSTLLLSSDSTWNDYRRRVEVLKAFMRHRKLPTRLRQRIQNYLDYLWATQKGINEGDILKELPATLQKQVTLFCSKGIIDKVPLFRGCSPDVSASIIASLLPRVYVPHDLIIERGARGDEFFIISEGVVVQLEADDEQGASSPRAYLHAGAYFGELAALLGGQRHESILALTHCFLYSLNHDALEDILHQHPECIDNMLANMMASYDVEEIKARLVEIEAATSVGLGERGDKGEYGSVGNQRGRIDEEDDEVGVEDVYE